jgi:hypothetical protein
MQQRPLLDLLGARWALGAPVVAAAWDAAGAVAGFALMDGTLALAPRSWPGAPRVAHRPSGGIELVPATAQPGPVVRVAVQDGGCRGIAAAPRGGFVTLGNAGMLAWTAADGAPQPPVAGLHDAVTVLAGSADGRMLALGHADGITLASADGTRPLTGSAAPGALACDAAGTVAAWSGAEGLQLWSGPDICAATLPGCPASPGSLTIFDAGRLLAAGGGTMPVCWQLDALTDEPGTVGPTGRHRVTAVAGHPARPLLAAGNTHGAAVLCQPGDEAVLFLRGAGGGAVTALAWSGDGNRLALGTASGEVAVLALPAALFRRGEAAA